MQLHQSPSVPQLYNPREDHDACGVGFVARLDARSEHQVIEDALQALSRLAHRGSKGADGCSGDGAGLLLPLPRRFLERVFGSAGVTLPMAEAATWGLGQFFLSRDPDKRRVAVALAEDALRAEGLVPLFWREVPVNPESLGETALNTRPEVRQVLVVSETTTASGGSDAAFERVLFLARRRMEKAAREAFGDDPDAFYAASLSSRSVVYKGMVVGSRLALCYPDLAEPDFTASFVVFHERYCTNTRPAWRLAQPFRYVAHNGEINTLRGNMTRMRVREPLLESSGGTNPLAGRMGDVLPLLDERDSDSAQLDRMLEFLVHGGRSLPHAMMTLVPEPFGNTFIMGEDKRAFYHYHAADMEPWDGPAALIFTDGSSCIGAVTDRNGLRPCRYAITRDGLIILASEAGVLDVSPARVLRRGRLQPRKMLMVDLVRHRLVSDAELKNKVIHARPYMRWVHDNRIFLSGLHGQAVYRSPEAPLRKRQIAHGYTREEVRVVLTPMIRNAQEAIGSMGNDAAPAALSDRPRLLFDYFRQQFAQVTNPPIDPLREEMVMTLMTYCGRQHNMLEETPDRVRQLCLAHPVLTPDELARLRGSRHPDVRLKELDATFPLPGTGAELEARLQALFEEAEAAVAEGASLLLLSDAAVSADRLPIPCLLAASGLHQHLMKKGLRHACGIVTESGEVREIIHFAQLIAFGVNAVCPSVAFETVREPALHFPVPMAPDEADRAYVNAVRKGLLKTLARLGISTLRGFWGTQAFEALGLGEELAARYFAGVTTRIGGIGLDDVAAETRERHQKAFGLGQETGELEQGGDYRYRSDGERRQWTPEAVRLLQRAARENDASVYDDFAGLVDRHLTPGTTLRGQLRFREGVFPPVPLDEVEPVEEITRRFCGAAMSLGSLSPEAHEAVAVALNRLGGRSNSGEGGEDPARRRPDHRGRDRRSRIRQIASGRFGVTLEYVADADELQIKMAQGAKPGEGGQLPAHKVTPAVAALRHSTPGVTLISPPPHHDIYSIEDLSQLIYDVKRVNPAAAISVKLVACAGIGTIAAGVAKAGADLILISGGDGGTGASPLTAIRHVGLPWEMGLAEVQHCLAEGGLRSNVRLQVDGGLKTGRDVVTAALLGAEEFGFGTALLIALGCCMLRRCHLDTCAFGVTSQRPELRCRFRGLPEHIENYLRFVAQDVRRHIAALGFRRLDELVGRVELLEERPPEERGRKAALLNLKGLLLPPSVSVSQRRCRGKATPVPDTPLETDLLRLVHNDADGAVSYTGRVQNVDRAVGARLSGELARRGIKPAPDTLRIRLNGSAGQSVGAFLASGITLRVEGEANDYAGKGLSGGTLIVTPPEEALFVPGDQTIIGNVALYGATGGEAYFHGCAGERFAVRNSGARAVVEGVGDHCCEYMTGGVVVVLGPTGYNFAAGMSGGTAFVYDPHDLFPPRCNMNSVDPASVSRPEDTELLYRLLARHVRFTGSPTARMILENWESSLPLFIKVMPVEYQQALERQRQAADNSVATVSASEEVFADTMEKKTDEIH